MAQTISDWPRPMSPATNTPGTRSAYDAVAGDVAALVELDAEVVEQPVTLGPGEAHGQQHQLAGDLRSVPATGSNRPLGQSTSVSRSARTPPSASPRNSCGGDGVDPLAALLVGGGHPVDHRVGRPRLVRRPASSAAGA